MANLGSVYVDVQGNFAPLQRQAAVQAATVSRTFTRSFGEAQRRNLRVLATTARYAAGIMTGVAVGAGAKLAKTGLELNASFESATAGIATFTGSMQKAERHIERLRKVSAESPLRLTDYVEASRLLQGFGVETRRVLPLLDAVNKAVVATGGNAETLNRIVIALGQIQAKGKVSAEEMLQLAEAGVPIQKILQRELGLTAEQVGNIGNEGVKAEKALDAIIKGWNQRYSAAYRNAAQTYNMQRARLVKNTEQLLRLTTEPFFEYIRDRWLPALNRTAEEVIKIWQQPGLTPEQRFDRAFAAIERNIGPLLDEIGQAIEESDLGTKLLEAYEELVPKAAEVAVKMGAKAAQGFAQGFLEAGILGKATLAYLFVRRMGLSALFWRRQGAQAAAAYAAGMGGALAPTTVAQRGGGGKTVPTPYGPIPVPLPGGPRIPGWLKAAGRFGLATAGVGALLGALSGTSGTGTSGLAQNIISGATWGLLPSASEDQAKAIEMVTEAIERNRRNVKALDQVIYGLIPQLRDWDQLTEEQAEELTNLAERTRFAATQVSRNVRRKLVLRDVEHSWSRSLRRMAGLTDSRLERIKRLMDDKPRKGVQALSRHFDRAVDAIRDAMRTGEIRTRKGLQQIHTILNRELQAKYGISHGDAEKILKAKKDGRGDGKGGWSGLARGGLITVPGVGRHDTVPLFAQGGLQAMVAPGEQIGVINRHQRPLLDAAVRAVYGVRDLPEFFRRYDRPHYMAKGGLIPKGGFPDAMGALPGLDALAWVLKRKFGLSVTSGLRPGARTTTGNVSDHSWGGAIDVSNGVTTPQMDAAYRWLKSVLAPAIKQILYRTWVGGNHFDHIHIALLPEYARNAAAVMRLIGGGAALGAFGDIRLPRFRAGFPAYAPHAVGLNRLAAGLEREMGRRFMAYVPAGAGTHPIEGVLSKAQIARIWRQANGAFGDANLMAAIALAESGGNPRAVGHDPGGTKGLGLWQITTGFNDDIIRRFGGVQAMFNPIANAKAAAAILRRQGLSAWAPSRHKWGRYMAQGGLLMPTWAGWFGKGGSFTARRPTILGVGERGPERVTVTPVGREEGPLRLRGQLQIANWRTGEAWFEGVADRNAVRRARSDRQHARMGRR